MNIFKCALVTSLTVLFVGALHAQTSEEEIRRKADSSQRIMMKDSLQISDSAVTQIFAVRDDMYQKVNAIRSNSALDDALQEQQVSGIREQTNQQIRAILGDEKYQHYLDIIRNKLLQRNMQSEKPLAGETAN